MVKVKIEYFIFLLAFIIKFMISMTVSIDIIFLLINFCFVLAYIVMLIRKNHAYSYIPFIVSDFLIGTYFCFQTFGYDFKSIFISLLLFIFSSGFLYSLIVNHSCKVYSYRQLKSISNMEIDKGIKALENNNYDVAIEAFTNAIKEHKKNYLGYMGMCSTLTKMDKKNLKKISYYKRKCIKYAPRELKETINDRFKGL